MTTPRGVGTMRAGLRTQHWTLTRQEEREAREAEEAAWILRSAALTAAEQRARICGTHITRLHRGCPACRMEVAGVRGVLVALGILPEPAQEPVAPAVRPAPSVDEVMVAIHKHGSQRAAAEHLGVSHGYVRDRVATAAGRPPRAR